MVSPTETRLPILNLSKEELHPGSNSWICIRDKVRQALEEFGCFEAYYDKVPLETHGKMYGGLKEVFDLPVEIKKKNVDKNVPIFGYAAPTEYHPLREGTAFGSADNFEKIQNFTNLMWPHGNSDFCETTYSYIQGLVKLEQMVKKMIFESYGMEKYVESNMKSINYVFSGKVYKTLEHDATALNAHTDQTFLTILHQNGINGLQIQTKDGEWFTLTPSLQSFIVMAGDSFMAWSNGRIHNPLHRVILSGKTTRYSIGFFTFLKEMVQTPEELVDEEHPLLFEPFKDLDLIKFIYSDVKKLGTIKEYCGV